MVKLTTAKKMMMKRKYLDLDTSGDGKLDLEEMKNLLRKGSPDMSDETLESLYNNVDNDGSGTVDFEEFVSYLYGKPVEYAKAPETVLLLLSTYDEEQSGLLPQNCEQFCLDCGLLGDGVKQQDINGFFARVLPRGKERINNEPGQDGLSALDRFLCQLADKKGVTPQELFQMIVTRGEQRNGGVPFEWDAETLRSLAREIDLEQSMEPLAEWLESGGRMRPMKIEGASAMSRWEYVRWLKTYVTCAPELEKAIARVAVMKAQDLFGEGYLASEIFADIWDEEVAVDVNPRDVSSWDAETVHEAGDELELDLSCIADSLDNGERMMPYEVHNATATTRWNYWKYLQDCMSLGPRDASRVEKAIARISIMNAEDIDPDFEPAEVLDSAFDEDDEEALQLCVETWNTEIARELGAELELDAGSIDALVSYLDNGNRMKPYDAEEVSLNTRWSYVCWLIDDVCLPRADAKKLEKAVARIAVRRLQYEWPEFEPPECMTSAFDDEPEAPNQWVVGTWTGDEARQIAQEEELDIGNLGDHLELSCMKPIDVKSVTWMSRWEFMFWLHERHSIPIQTANRFEEVVTRAAIQYAQQNCGEDTFTIPQAAQNVFE